jgi:hypothetical protein
MFSFGLRLTLSATSVDISGLTSSFPPFMRDITLIGSLLVM